MQNADKSKPFEVFPEKVASALGANTPCPHFNFALTKFVNNPSCTNYAVGGGRVNTRGDTKAVIDTTTPLSILNQMSAGSPSLAASDIVVVDGGANDMADLVGAYLAVPTPDGLKSFTNKLSTVLPAATVAALVTPAPTATTLNTAALAYAQGLAQLMVQTINDKILARGVRKVVVINVVDISATPIFGGGDGNGGCYARFGPTQRGTDCYPDLDQCLQPGSGQGAGVEQCAGSRPQQPVNTDFDATCEVWPDQHHNTRLPSGGRRVRCLWVGQSEPTAHSAGLQLIQPVVQRTGWRDFTQLVAELCVCRRPASHSGTAFFDWHFSAAADGRCGLDCGKLTDEVVG